MWATIVAKDGTVCAVAFSGTFPTHQWLASRVISCAKGHHGEQPELGSGFRRQHQRQICIGNGQPLFRGAARGSLYGLADSNPVAAAGAYGDRIDLSTGAFIGPANVATYGTLADPMVGQVIGGINVFGGGLAMFDSTKKVGGVGVSGDTSCTDHMVAWQLRHGLNLDLLATAGISGAAGAFSADVSHPDNIIWDITPNPNGGTGNSASGFGHPTCFNNPGIDPITHSPTTLPQVQ